MDEDIEDVQGKTELKEEFVLSPIESGADTENFISKMKEEGKEFIVIKKEEEEFAKPFVDVVKEENHLVQIDSETKPPILTSLIKNCSVVIKNEEIDTKKITVVKEKTEVKYNGDQSLSCFADDSQTADSAEGTENPYSKYYKFEGPEGGIKNIGISHSLSGGNLKVAKRKKCAREKKFECTVCWKHFISSTVLKRHMKIHAEKAQKNYQCKNCDYESRYRDCLMEHMKNIHSTLSFICNDCGKGFESKIAITEHLKIKNNLLCHQYCCSICGKACTAKNNLKKHLNLHNEVYSFKCAYCNMSFKEKGGLKMHFLHVHQLNTFYKCLDCGKSFKTKSNLSAHNEVHHISTKVKFTCDICHMKFTRDCYLKRHIQTHTDADKKYECEECGLKCRSKTDITKHILTHFGGLEKPHACDVCSAAFTKPSHLVRHMRVHSNNKVFACKLCDKAYKDTSSLKIHHESVHCGSTFSCNDCGFSSKNRHSFNRHLRKCISLMK